MRVAPCLCAVAKTRAASPIKTAPYRAAAPLPTALSMSKPAGKEGRLGLASGLGLPLTLTWVCGHAFTSECAGLLTATDKNIWLLGVKCVG